MRFNLSREIVEKWLKTWMFKNDHDKNNKARNIVECKTNLHETHNRLISMKEAREKGLIVEALERNDEFQDKVLLVFPCSNGRSFSFKLDEIY
ncbi:MAG TPA: hypothetical protein ENI33_00035 [Thermoplasmatales archaeon]|nr:hypothetical protein [Thermoplasmatales archaeon]